MHIVLNLKSEEEEKVEEKVKRIKAINLMSRSAGEVQRVFVNFAKKINV